MIKNLSLEQEMALVENAKKDIGAFAKLYDLYFPKLYGFVVYLVGNHEDAEDIVSETFEKSLSNLQKYEHRGFRFGSWLYKIARNLVYDRSKAKTSINLDSFEMFATDENLDERINDQVEVEKLGKFVTELKAEQREVVVLRYVDGYSIKETSIITGRSEDSVKSACKRALLNIRKEMPT